MIIKTDVLVVGGGPGGYVAAIKLGQLGKKALIVDSDKLGGECLNYGCIPSKALIGASAEAQRSRKNVNSGFCPEPMAIDWEKVVTWKNRMTSGFAKNIALLVQGNKGSVLLGRRAKLTSPHGAILQTPQGATETVEFEHAIIATGSEPLGIPGFAIDGDVILGSKEALDLPQPPQSLVVIGGGVIGLEIGTIFAKLGTKVTVVEFTDSLLPVIEKDMTVPVQKGLTKLGVDVFLSSKAKSWSKNGALLDLTVETPEGTRQIACEKVLLAVGRAPRSKDMGLQDIGVELDKRGHIRVDSEMLTSVDNIYAIGDVVGQPYLAHKASREAVLAARSIAGLSIEPRGHIPWAVFTDPEISWVGQTDAQAASEGLQTITGKFPFTASGRAQAARDIEGFCKVVADKNTHRILGAGFTGPHASDLLGEACLAVSAGLTLEQVAAAVHPHPTLSEAFPEACEAALGHPLHTLPAKRP